MTNDSRTTAEAMENRVSAIKMKKKTVLEQLKDFEEKNQRRLDRARELAEKELQEANEESEGILIKEKERLEKDSAKKLKGAEDKAREEAKGIIREYHDKTVSLRQAFSERSGKAVDAVYEEILK